MNEKRAFAKTLRENPTAAEATLWEYLRKEQLGYRFWRQQLLQGYVVDFYCPRASLVVEVDGSVHELPQQACMDESREKALGKIGVGIVRFGNEEVLTSPQLILRKIRHECEARIAPLKAVVFDLKQPSYNSRSRSRSLCESGKPPATSFAVSELNPSTFEEIGAEELRRLEQQVISFARQKAFPFTNYDSRPAAEKVHSQKLALQEWLKKKA